eukprot:g1774.t1
MSGYGGNDADSDQDTETESYVNNAEPWKQGIGGLVAPRTFAARFFVTRLGFMRRKCRRMMAFTSDRLYIVRVDDGKAKASYPLKSVQLAPSDKVNQGKGIILTSDIGNVRHSFKCRDRTSLLAAFSELQDAARDRPLNLLFQVIKRSKTRGDVKMTLRVGPTSLDRVDGERLQHRVSSLPLLSVEKVYLFTDDATQMLVDCHGGRRRRYWCAARDSLVRAMEDHLRHLGRTGEQPLPVERVGTWEVDTSTRNPESVKQGYLFEVPVQKWSRTERTFKNRLLALTKSSVVEMDVATRDHLREFPLEMIFNIVYHTPDTIVRTPEADADGSNGNGLSIEVQMAWGGSSTYNFQACRCSAVSTDSIMAFTAIADDDAPLEESRKAEERQFRGSHVPDLATLAEMGGAGADGVCGYHDLRLTAVEARVHFLANFLEVCRLNHHGCPWSLRRVTNENRVGELTGGLHPDYQEFLLKRTAGLSAIARAGPGKVLADPDARGYALAVLDELNFSTPVAFKHKEKGAAAAAMSLLAPSALQHFDDSGRVSLLLAVLRLLWSKTGYDEVTRAECQPAIDGVFKCLASEDHTVSYPAALVIRSMLTHPRKDSAWWSGGGDNSGSGASDEGLGADRKLEKANRKALFGHGNEKQRLEQLLAPCFAECMKPDGVDEDFGSDLSDSDEEGDDFDGPAGESNIPLVTMAGVGPPPAGPECLVQAVLMEVLVILVSSGDKQADRAVVEAVWELLHEFDAMCRLLANVRSPCLPLAKASMQLLAKMHNSKRFSVGPRSILQDTARDSGILLWVMFLAMDAREPDMCRVAGRLCRALTDGDARSLGVLTRSFPPGLLAPSPPDQLFNECGAAVWGTAFIGADSLDLHARWGILSQDVRDVEVVWSPVHRDALGQLLLEQLQELERETKRLSYKGRGGRAPPEALAWNDAAWEVPWHNMVGEVKVGRYFLEQLIADLDSSKESSSTIRQRLGNPTALGNFLQLCHLRLLHERDASSLELVFDTMTCLFQHLGSRAVPMLPFLGSVLHMLTYSLPAILGPVGAAEESPLDTDDEGSEKDTQDADGGPSGAGAEPKSGAQATATYYAAVQFVRVCMDNQPANVRLFVMHGGVETFVELVGSAFQHAHSLTASSSSAAPLAITSTDGEATTPSGGADGTGASPTRSSGSEEHFGSSTSNGNRVPRRERASDLSVALTCRELVVECISCLSSALEVFPAQDLDGKMFFPKPPPKRQLANPVALAALVDLLASEEEAVLHPALTLLVTVVRGGLEIPLSAGARGRIVVRCLRHACEGRCAELCAELLGAEAVAAPPARLSDGGMGGAVGPVSAPREGAILARSPLYPLLPGALVRLMVTKGARAFAEALLADGLETPTVVWNSECRHMLGVVLRELEGATPGLQDVPAIEVHEAGRRLEALYSEKGGVPVLFTSPYYVQLMDENYRIEYPSAFLLEVASSMTEVLQGPPDIYEGQGKGRVQCISTPLENEGDVIYLHEPLLWTLRQHATNGVSGPDSLARAIGAVAPPLLEITARVAVACSFSPEALTSLASFTESLSLCLGFLARANRLSAQTWSGMDGSGSVPVASRRVSHGGGRRSGRRSSAAAGGRRRAVGSGGGAADGGPNGGGWTVAVDLRKVDALLTMLKQLDDQESAGHLMGAGNQILRSLKEPEVDLSEGAEDVDMNLSREVPGLTSYVGGLVSSLSTLEAPSAILAATEGIGLAALGLGKEAHIDLLYKSQVFVPLIAHCVRPQVSEDRPGGHPGLGLQSAKALQSLAEANHDGTNAALAALLTPGGLAVLRRSPEELVRVLRSPVLLETPKLVWGPKCREELEELLKQPAPEPDIGGHRGRGAAVPVVTPASGRCRRFKPRELDGFVFASLQDELVVDDVYLRILVRDAERQGGSEDVAEARRAAAAAATGLGQGLELPSDLLASVFVYLGDQMRLIVAGQVPTATADRELFFQDVALLLQALLGLAVGEEQVPEVLEDSGDALNLLWSATQPYLRDGLAGPAAPSITRSVVQLMHAFLTKGGPSAGEALVASGAVAPAVHACGKMLADDYDLSAFTHEDGVAALHVAAMLLDAKPSAAGHMVSIGAVPMFLSRACHKDFIKSTRLRCAAILHRLCVSVPAASIGLGRVMPELLLLHLEADATGESLMRHLDDEAVSPILVWDASCRDRLSSLAWAHWEDWRRRGKVGASLRWVPAYLPEEVLLPDQHSSEPCVAGLYFRLYAAEPGFALEKDMVEGFLVCSVEAMLHGRVADELLPILLEALYYALACLGDGALAGASRKANGLWPIIFSLIWKELDLGSVRYDPSARPARGMSNEVAPQADADLSQGEAILRWGARIVCLLASVPVHWTVAGAGAQIVSDEHALSMVHSAALDDHSLGLFLVTARSIVASKTNEGMDVAHHFVSPLVLRALVDKLTSYQPPLATEAPDTSNNRVSKYGRAPGTANAPPKVEQLPDERDEPPPPTVVEDLVIKLLACLMVHPQQGQRARLVLRDEVPENVYMALHRAGSVPADIKGDAVTAQPPPPHRDTDHKLYPKKGNAAGGAAGAQPVFATGGAKAPGTLARPLSIFVTPAEEETAPVTVSNVENVGAAAGSQEGEEEEKGRDVASVSEASQSPTKREGSLRRSVVFSRKSQRTAESSQSPPSRLPSVSANYSSTTEGYGGGGDGGPGTPNGKGRGLLQRASVSWAKSSLNPINGGNVDVHQAKAARAEREKVDVVTEERPLTLPASPKPDPVKARTLSMRALATRLSPRPAPEVSPTNSSGTKGRSVMGWGSSSVASSMSPGPATSPKPNAHDGRRGF